MTQEDLPDPRDQMTKIAQRLPDCTIFDGAELYLDRFDQFNKQELEILAALLRRVQCVDLSFLDHKSLLTEFVGGGSYKY